MRVNLMFMEWLSSDYIAAFFAFAIIVLVLVVFWVFSLSKRLVGDLEVLENKPVKVFVTFFVYLAIGLLIAWLVVYSLQNAGGVSSIFYFTILPYMALLMFAIGTVVRYRETGFKVSSLSSQFLEGRKLFWGSQPFHWGILVLFFGHLVAFMFPASILAWNRVPARLLFLEGSAFAFALLTLLGLAMFVYRRFTNKRVQIVTTRTDLVVYVVLLVQVLTGMGVAYYVRWGSSWFA
ncbi:MAG: respiratory nitrate reductase subunit gamma, partial [Cyclobacteriaceae bacterium]|nr:respiratory nitrate reductase subunit gamma [Cyclobacteriaceae bacterium]